MSKLFLCFCKNCGKEFEEYLCRIRNNRGKYCSKECFSKYRKGKPNIKNRETKNANWKGGISYEYANRLKQKKECEICKQKTNLRIHHKDRNRKNNKIENLIVVCEACHRKIHNKDKYQKIKKKCLQCQKTFFVGKREKTKKFCSRQCYKEYVKTKNWKRGIKDENKRM